jgi:hypothetical protein
MSTHTRLRSRAPRRSAAPPTLPVRGAVPAVSAFWASLALGALAPGAAFAQAEAAPPGSVAPPDSAPRAAASSQGDPPRRPLPARVRVAGNVRFSGLLGETATAAAPLGWGFGLQLSAALLPVGYMRFGFVLDFAQDRFQRAITGYPETPQLLLHNTFAVQALLDLPTRFVRPYLAVGAGLSAARHESPLPDPAQQAPQTLELATLPLVRVSAGVAVSPLRWFEIGVSGELSFTFSDHRGGVLDQGTMAAPAMAQLFSPGWGSLATWVGYCFY